MRTHDPASCGHANADHRGLPKHGHKTSCHDFCTFIAEGAQRDFNIKDDLLRKVERVALHSMFEALHTQLEVYPDLEFRGGRETFLDVFADSVQSEASGVGIVVDCLQELLRDAAGAIVASSRESSTAALVAATALVAEASAIGHSCVSMADMFADKDI